MKKSFMSDRVVKNSTFITFFVNSQNLQENCETLHSSIQFLSDIISKVTALLLL